MQGIQVGNGQFVTVLFIIPIVTDKHGHRLKTFTLVSEIHEVLGMLSELAFPHIRCCLSVIPLDLMKSTTVDESLSSMNQQFCSRENQLLQMLQQNEKSTQMRM